MYELYYVNFVIFPRRNPRFIYFILLCFPFLSFFRPSSPRFPQAFTGVAISPLIGSLSSLNYLNLAWNGFAGPIPTQVSPYVNRIPAVSWGEEFGSQAISARVSRKKG